MNPEFAIGEAADDTFIIQTFDFALMNPPISLFYVFQQEIKAFILLPVIDWLKHGILHTSFNETNASPGCRKSQTFRKIEFVGCHAFAAFRELTPQS